MSDPDSRRNLPVVYQAPSEMPESESFIGRLLRRFGWKSGSLREDLEVVLEAGAPASDTGFTPEETAMLRNILGLRERRVDDVMIPRADIVAVQQDIGLGELLRVFETAGHSRLVVYAETLDDAVGMVHIRDLLAFMTASASSGAQASTRRKKPFPAGLDLRAIDLSAPLARTQLVRDMLFVPPSMPAMDLLSKMQKSRMHLALVIDEYGGTDGLVSLEDIVEQIVGEIDDEHDLDEAPDIVAQPDGTFLADARASLEDVSATVGPDFDVGEAAEDVDTLGGYLFAQVGRVPVRGEVIPGPGPLEIEVLDADPRRVKKLKISRAPDRAAPLPQVAVPASLAESPVREGAAAHEEPAELPVDRPPRAARGS